MTALRLDGLLVAQMIRRELAVAVTLTTKLIGRPPCLAVVQVEGDRSSDIFVRTKRRAAESCGMQCRVHLVPAASATTETLAAHIASLNACSSVDGIIAQLPLPSHICRRTILSDISPSKDVDGMHPLNVAAAFDSAEAPFIPCTALGVRILLDQYGISTAGKHAVVVGRGPIAGRSIAVALGHSDATVTICHKQTQNLGAISSSAELLVSATGCASLITPRHVRPGAVVIDVGAAFDASGRLVGDVESQVAEVAGAITPVPGGVGPMTVVGLLLNTFTAYTRNNNINRYVDSLRFCSLRRGGAFTSLQKQ